MYLLKDSRGNTIFHILQYRVNKPIEIHELADWVLTCVSQNTGETALRPHQCIEKIWNILKTIPSSKKADLSLIVARHIFRFLPCSSRGLDSSVDSILDELNLPSFDASQQIRKFMWLGHDRFSDSSPLAKMANSMYIQNSQAPGDNLCLADRPLINKAITESKSTKTALRFLYTGLCLHFSFSDDMALISMSMVAVFSGTLIIFHIVEDNASEDLGLAFKLETSIKIQLDHVLQILMVQSCPNLVVLQILGVGDIILESFESKKLLDYISYNYTISTYGTSEYSSDASSASFESAHGSSGTLAPIRLMSGDSTIICHTEDKSVQGCISKLPRRTTIFFS